MNFKKYMHIERLQTDEVDGIELGVAYIFSKIDGTNSSLWLDGGDLKAGSRNRELSLENDNAGFYAWALQQYNICRYLSTHPTHRLYGEWLVPHSLKTYRQEAWRRFYVFDVSKDIEKKTDCEDGFQKTEIKNEYLHYDIYSELLDEFKIDYIPILAKVTNGSYDQLIHYLENNTFLVQDGKGNGEGIVIKNYDFYNRSGDQVWAKIVRTEFKEMAAKVFGAPEINGNLIEEKIIDVFCTETLIDKTYHKIVADEDGWKSRYIPRLLETVFYDLVREEIWSIIKAHKNPKICFKTLRNLCVQKTKIVKKELFS